jgi:hypothetical protein
MEKLFKSERFNTNNLKGDFMPKGKSTKSVSTVMKEFRADKLNAGTKSIPKTKGKKQTLAMAINAAKPKVGKAKKLN